MSHFGQIPVRIAAIAVLAAGLALSGCGRKGPLEPPPSSQTVAPDGAPESQGAKKRIPLDALLD